MRRYVAALFLGLLFTGQATLAIAQPQREATGHIVNFWEQSCIWSDQGWPGNR